MAPTDWGKVQLRNIVFYLYLVKNAVNNLLYLNIGLLEIFVLLLFIPLFILKIYCLFDISRSKFNEPLNKLLWVIIVIFVPLIGEVLYLFVGRSQKKVFDKVNKQETI